MEKNASHSAGQIIQESNYASAHYSAHVSVKAPGNYQIVKQ